MNEFEKKLAKIQDIEPDRIDKAMIKAAEEDDSEPIPLEDFKCLYGFQWKDFAAHSAQLAQEVGGIRKDRGSFLKPIRAV